IEFNGDELGVRIEFGEPDADNFDVALCIAANVAIGIMVKQLVPLVALQLGILAFKDKTTLPDGLLRLALPFRLGHIPSTESVAEAPGLAVTQDSRTFTLLGDIRLKDDIEGHYFYFRVVGAVAGDDIVVMDQDSPALPGDDPLVVLQPEVGT